VFSKRGYDVAAVNFRGCSGELGAQPLGYHLGFTDDLRFVLQEVMLCTITDLYCNSLRANLDYYNSLRANLD
jgi:predicted alpha/beta-fold hydrolase